MMQRLLKVLIMLLVIVNLSVAKESKTLWDQIESKSQRYGLKPVLTFIDDDQWSFKGNVDYEKFIDVMINVLETTELPRDLYWYEKKETILLIGFFSGFILAK